jgi:4-hydroxy-tetrahydrodipicolinate synthase
MDNATIRALAKLPNVVGLKDCAGDLVQSSELLLEPPPGFAILTGEDAAFYPMLALGAAGGILASAHWATRAFVAVWRAMAGGDHRRARALWARLAPGVRLLFSEPSPAPVKQMLVDQGLLASAEVRLPLVPASETLQERLRAIGRGAEEFAAE